MKSAQKKKKESQTKLFGQRGGSGYEGVARPACDVISTCINLCLPKGAGHSRPAPNKRNPRRNIESIELTRLKCNQRAAKFSPSVSVILTNGWPSICSLFNVATIEKKKGLVDGRTLYLLPALSNYKYKQTTAFQE